MKFKNTLLSTAAAAAALPLSALAHVGADGGGHHHFLDSLSHAFAHPFTGADHLAAMLAVGAWSALTMPSLRTAWRAPAAFVALLVAGALAGFAGLWVPGVEPMIAASVLVLGLLVLVQKKMPWGVAAALAVPWQALRWAQPPCISRAWCSATQSCSAIDGWPNSAVQRQRHWALSC